MISVAGCGTHETTDTDHHHQDDRGVISNHAQTDDHGATADQLQVGDQVPDFEVTLNGTQWKRSAFGTRRS